MAYLLIGPWTERAEFYDVNEDGQRVWTPAVLEAAAHAEMSPQEVWDDIGGDEGFDRIQTIQRQRAERELQRRKPSRDRGVKPFVRDRG